MSSRLNPYLSFSGNARDAMEFYKSVFGGDLRISTFGEYGPPGAAHADKVMHGMLETPMGFTLMGSDTPPEMKDVTQGNNITVSLSGDDANELRGYWKKLSASGKVAVPLEKQTWGDEFGSCTDKFGVDWMVDIMPREG